MAQSSNPEVQHDPPNEPTALTFTRAAVSAIEGAFQTRAMADSTGNTALNAPGALADTIGLGLRQTMDLRFSNRSDMLRVNGTVTRDPDGGESYTIRARTGDGTGVDINVDRNARVRVTPLQSLTTGSEVRLPSQDFRWEIQPGERQGILQTAISSGGSVKWVAAESAGSLGAPEGLSGTANMVIDGGAAALAAGGVQNIARLLDRDPGPGIRAFRDGADVSLPTSYQQDGTVRYNGITVVEQQIRNGQNVLYNKGDLLDRARSPEHLDRLLDEGGRQRLLVTPSGTDSLPLDRADQLDRGMHR